MSRCLVLSTLVFAIFHTNVVVAQTFQKDELLEDENVQSYLGMNANDEEEATQEKGKSRATEDTKRGEQPPGEFDGDEEAEDFS